jgi:hypothetical protein
MRLRRVVPRKFVGMKRTMVWECAVVATLTLTPSAKAQFFRGSGYYYNP